MNKILLTLLLLFGSHLFVCAQNQIEAKAAYLLAEESFAGRDYLSTLEYLDKATKSLGNTNSKLLYLQIQAELELYKTDSSYYDKVIKTIADFQGSADVNSFTEEKIVEVAKLKMSLAKEREIAIKNSEAKRIQDEKIENYQFEGWPFGVTFDELKLANKDRRFFQRKTVTVADPIKVFGKSGLTFHFPKKSDAYTGTLIMHHFNSYYFDDVYGITTENDIVKGYSQAIYARSNENDITKDESLAEIQQIVDDLTNHFGFQPEYSKDEDDHGATYRWSNGNKAISLYVTYGFRAEFWHNWVMKEIIVK